MQLDRPVAFFDSGVGGLTAVAEFVKFSSCEDVLYFADTANMPYGDRPIEDIEGLAVSALTFLSSFNPSIVVIACGTVGSVLSFRGTALSRFVSVPVVCVIKPSCVAAVRFSVKKRIGIMATSATIATESYRNVLFNIDPTIEVFEEPCPKLASFIEECLAFDSAKACSFHSYFPSDNFFKKNVFSTGANILDSEALNVKTNLSSADKLPETGAELSIKADLGFLNKLERNKKGLSNGNAVEARKVLCSTFVGKRPSVNNGFISFGNSESIGLIKKYLEFFCDKDIDVLILGCTHYPLIENYVSSFFGGKVSVVSSSREVARRTVKFLESRKLTKKKSGPGNLFIYVSGDADSFSRKAEKILPKYTFKKIKIEHVSL